MSELGEGSVQELAGRVDALRRHVQDLDVATRRGKWVGRFMVLAIAAVAIFSLWNTFTSLRAIPPHLYAHYAAEQADYLLPTLEKNARKVAENLAPVYEQAFRKEFERAMPLISQKAGEELNLFFVHVGDGLESRIEKGIRGIVDAHVKALANDHPELKDAARREKVVEQAKEVYYAAAEGVTREVLSEQTTALADLGATFDTFEIPDEIKNLNDEKLIERIKDQLLEFLALRLSLVDEGIAPGRSQSTAPGGDPQ